MTSLQEMEALLSTKLTPITDRLGSIEFNLKENTDTLKKLENQSQQIKILQTQTEKMSIEVQSLKNELAKTKQLLVIHETHSRRSNLQFIGIAENKG